MAAILQGVAERRKGVDALDLGIESVLSQQLEHQLGIHGVIFKMQDSQVWIHVRHSGLPTVPGGGSLTSAQKTPSSRTASTKALNSTGLTTYALTPSR